MRTFHPYRLEDGVLAFPPELRPGSLDRLLDAVWTVIESGRDSVVLDLSAVVRAFPNSVLPIIGVLPFLAKEGVRHQYIPPANPDSERFFQRTNWSHLFDPEKFDRSDSASDRHLAAFRYSDADGQYSIVREIVDRVMRATPIDRSALNALDWSLSEITDNVLTHAEAPQGGIAQLEVMHNRLAFCVVDGGRGVLRSLRPAFPNLKTDGDAIEHAVRAGVTRNKDIGQGNGLSGSLALAIAFQGQFAMRSYYASVLWTSGQPLRLQESESPFPGTVIDLQMRSDLSVSLGPVIAGKPDSQYQPRDVVEDLYLNSDLRTYSIRMADETFGFGSRSAGKQMRTKLQNLLNAAGSAPVSIDWDGVQIIASSYADEAIGKLFVELGPMAFMQRVRLVNMSELVAKLIDKAILQRSAVGRSD